MKIYFEINLVKRLVCVLFYKKILKSTYMFIYINQFIWHLNLNAVPQYIYLIA